MSPTAASEAETGGKGESRKGTSGARGEGESERGGGEGKGKKEIRGRKGPIREPGEESQLELRTHAHRKQQCLYQVRQIF